MIALRLRRPGEAEDLAQEVFLKAQAGLPHLAQPASFRPWLFSIALNQVRDFRRRERLWGLVGLGPAWEADPAEEAVAAPGENAFDEVWQGEFHRRLHEFSQRLSRREREVFLLRFVDELTLPETAQALDLHVSAVKTHLYRALAKFKADRQFRAFLRELEP
ncbi:MAG: RNA polymerase sigma factor [Deltaproteobacteria bacterium]|nr:RNA polymerase sigma factor [Deltaproteobacteria bacterium]